MRFVPLLDPASCGTPKVRLGHNVAMWDLGSDGVSTVGPRIHDPAPHGDDGPQRPQSIAGWVLWLVAIGLLGGAFLNFLWFSVERAIQSWPDGVPWRSVTLIGLAFGAVTIFVLTWRGSRSRLNSWWRVSADACVRAGAASFALLFVAILVSDLGR